MIRVVVDDLAFVGADAVLRAADHTLAPATPAMSRLDTVAGSRFAALRTVSMPLDAGAAVVTGAGDLTAPFVLHVVIQDAERPVSREQVRRALVSAWHQAREWALATVAAPVIGTGPGGMALEEAAELLIETFAAGAGNDGDRALMIVVDGDEERQQVLRILQRRGH